MTSSPDKLFRDGLGEYRKPAPASAWDRIESGLHRRQQKSIWLKIAASITVLLAVSFLFWPDQQVMDVADIKSNVPTQVIVDNPPKVSPETAPASPSPTLADIAEPVEKSIAQKPSFKNDHQKSQATGEIIVVETHQDDKGNLVTAPVETISDSYPIATVIAAVSNTQPESSPSRMHLTYSSKYVQSKFRKKDLPVEATPEKKNSSGIQKIMDLAFELKNDDSMYGDLRQKKNEILSLSFLDSKRGPHN
jgi:hypothetical protein